MPDYQRDITLTGGSNDYFVAPGDYDYWLYNPPTNSSVTISKSGKAPILISAGEVLVIHLSKGEEIALSGTAGNVLSILDHSDVKLIPATKDVLGKFNLAGPSTVGGTDTNVQIIATTGQAQVETFDSSGNQITTYANNAAPPLDGTHRKFAVAQVAGSTWNTTLVATVAKIGNVGILDASQNAFSNSNRLPVQANVSYSTLIEAEQLAPTSVPGATVETVETAGSTTLALGQRVYYNISAGTGVLTTAADVLTYVALKLHTNAFYMATAFLGQGGVSGYFDVPIADTLDIVVRNQDTVAHGFAGSWQAMSA